MHPFCKNIFEHVKLLPRAGVFGFTSVRSLLRKSSRDALSKVYGPEFKYSPFPYKKRRYTLLTMCYDTTLKRIGTNSKIIIVEGSLASGKTQLAKYLAKELDFEYFPEANQDMYHINYYGYDLRKLDGVVPKSCRSLDINNFLLQPNPRVCSQFQFWQFRVKFHQYVDAMVHLLHTGQGVVLERCVYSDMVFIEAMFHQKLISKQVKNAYYELRRIPLQYLFKPHLFIYLHAPVDKILENIKCRNLPHEVNSQVLTPEYLQAIEDCYKTKFLKYMKQVIKLPFGTTVYSLIFLYSQFSEVLTYDWSNGMPEDCDSVLEDIERLDLDRLEYPISVDRMFPDWRLMDENGYSETRALFSSSKARVLSMVWKSFIEIPELWIDPGEAIIYNQITSEAPGEKFARGFNPEMGDKLLDMWSPSRLNELRLQLLPKRERRTAFPPICEY